MSEDALYSNQFKELIVNFCKVAANAVYVKDLAGFIVAFCQSRILYTLLSDPEHDGAKTCVSSFLADNPTLPKIFLSRFLAVANLRINIMPVRFGHSMNNSCMVSVIPSSTKPPAKITNMTAYAKRDQLREDSKHASINQASNQNLAARVRINYTPQLMDQLVNSMIGFHKVVDEGNRQNGYQMNAYVRVTRES